MLPLLAMKQLILQAITSDNHATAVRQLMSLPDAQQIIICTAFMNESGVSILESELSKASKITTIYTGIRNGVTSYQGLKKILEIGCKIFIVDTGSRNRIFHPKLYLSHSNIDAEIITGSANLTFGGLYGNIEYGVWLKFSLENSENASFVSDIIRKIESTKTDFPLHVLEVCDLAMANKFLAAGLLVDENITPIQEAFGSSARRDLDSIPLMPLRVAITPNKKTQPKKTQLATSLPALSLSETGENITPVSGSSTANNWLLAWESKPLSRRSLGIPIRGNPTASTTLGKGNIKDIDQITYFRFHVFNNLNWTNYVNLGGKDAERANARFHIVVKGIDHGIFELTVRHNFHRAEAAEKDDNIPTELGWNDAKDIVKNADLLGRTLRLFKNDLTDPAFRIEID